MSFYLSTLVVYFFIDALLAWALNLQYGWAGIPNFALIMFQAVGAYAAAVVSLGPDNGINSFQRYVFGASWPFPLPLVAAVVAGGVLALVVGSFSLRRIRRDYQAAILLIVSLIAIGLVSNVVGLVNGSNGLTGIPKPLSGVLASLNYDNYQWVYAAWTGVIAVAVYLLVARLGRSGWGRALRAVRDHEDAAATISLNPAGLRMQAFVLSGMIAALSGGLLVEFLASWSPAAWGYAETFAVFTSIILGGVGNNWGVVLGTLLVQVIFLQVPTFLPQVGYTGLIDALQWVLIGILWLACLALRPRGLLPERRYRAVPAAVPEPVAPSAAPVPPTAVPRSVPIARSGRLAIPRIGGYGGQGERGAGAPRAGGLPPRGTTVLEVRDISVRFGGVEAVRDVTLQVSAGEVVGLIGPNGAGKSSLLGALGGQFAVASGRVLLSGHDVTSLPPYRRARLGLVRTFQHTSTFDGLTVFENLLVSAMSARGSSLRVSLAGQRARQAEAAESVWERLREFELTAMADKYGSELSGGQRRLVEIMRCLMQSPQVLLLDEPMVGVAPHLVERISDDCARISESGVAVVIVEHALEVIQAVCGRVVVMASGKVVAQASYAEAMSSGAVQEAYFL
jgi:ABC-type branched-subunit amino acid transport system ATPase component/ABC-type branched-subunit amino acid transport system permease subunit